MISDAELQAYAQSIVGSTALDVRGIGCLVVVWAKGQPSTPSRMCGDVEPGRDPVRLLREMADALDRRSVQDLARLIRPPG